MKRYSIIPIFIVLLAMVFSFQNCAESGSLPSKSTNSSSSTPTPTPGPIVLVDPNLAISKNILEYGEALDLVVTNAQDGVTYDWYINDVLEVKGGTATLAVPAVDNLKHTGEFKVIANGEKVSNKVAVQVGLPRSCKQINTVTGAGTSPDGVVTIDGDGPLGADDPVDVYCVHSMNGGGWMRVTYAEARDAFGATLTALNGEAGTSSNMRTDSRGPVARDAGGNHAYRFQFRLPYQFREFFLRNYRIQANSPDNGSGDVSEINGGVFAQSVWGAPNNSNTLGDVSFGGTGGDNTGPVTSFGAAGVNMNCRACDIPFPNMNVYTLTSPSRNFRIEFGESGGEGEGWFAWEAGLIHVR